MVTNKEAVKAVKARVASTDPEVKYILITPAGVLGQTERPTQDEIKGLGAGEYVLRRADGAVIKSFTVYQNQKGNLSITSATPQQLEGVSTYNLHRLVKRYEGIVKLWPAKQVDVKKVTTEIDSRMAVLSAAGVK